MNQNRPEPPKAIDIVLYWDSMQWDSKTESVPTLEDGTKYPSLVDWGEPSCMACGCWNSRWDIDTFTDGDFDHNKNLANERWERSELEKAHIVGYALDGPNIPSNFLMLCPYCHFAYDCELSIADIKDLNLVFKWLENRVQQKYDQVIAIIDDFIEEKKYDKHLFYACCGVAFSKVISEGKKLNNHILNVVAAADTAYTLENNTSVRSLFGVDKCVME